jgi:hypothetical protein
VTRRLFWVGVGVGLTVLVVRYGRTLVARYVPADAAAALGTAGRLTRTARGLRDEFAAGMAEREQELLEALVGDEDPDELKAKGREAWAAVRDGRRGTPRHVPADWADGPLEDPDDDDGYSFF